MKRFTCFALVVVALFIATPAGNAQVLCNRARVVVVPQRVAVPVAVAAVVATPVVAAVFQPVPVFVPTYGAGYSAGLDQYQTKELFGRIDNLERAVTALANQTRILNPNPAPQAGPPPKLNAVPPPVDIPMPPADEVGKLPRGHVVMASKCANCHDETTAKKGNNVVLFKGGRFIDTDENANKVLEQIDSDKMPKDGKLSAREKYDVLWALTVREAVEKK